MSSVDDFSVEKPDYLSDSWTRSAVQPAEQGIQSAPQTLQLSKIEDVGYAVNTAEIEMAANDGPACSPVAELFGITCDSLSETIREANPLTPDEPAVAPEPVPEVQKTWEPPPIGGMA